MVYGLSTRLVLPPGAVDLRSHRLEAAEPGPEDGYPPSDPLASLSFGTPRAAAPLEALLEPTHLEVEAMEVEDTPAFQLRPPSLPTPASGLEELFEGALALDAQPEPGWHWTTSRWPLFAGLGILLGIVVLQKRPM